MDTLWLYILALITFVKNAMDVLLYPLNTLHPALSVTLLAAVSVAFTSAIKRRFTTRRYKRLKEEFESLYAMRQEALKSFEDPSKGKRMARNIDQASLNRVYYDFFFEGLLNNLITTYLPILCMAAYVNEAFRPEALQGMIGRPALFILPFSNAVEIGALPWFVLCLIACWLGMWLVRKFKQDGTAGSFQRTPLLPLFRPLWRPVERAAEATFGRKVLIPIFEPHGTTAKYFYNLFILLGLLC